VKLCMKIFSECGQSLKLCVFVMCLVFGRNHVVRGGDV
jgi:hypothetical protein